MVIKGCDPGTMKYSVYQRKTRLCRIFTGITFVLFVYFFWTRYIDGPNEIAGLNDIKYSDYPPLGIRNVEVFPEGGEYRIPRILHQTWKTTNIPHDYVEWMITWTKFHPGWTYMFWTDEAARKLIADRHPELLSSYDGYQENIRRADAMRYVILYEFGGVYADLDMESLQPMDNMLRKYSCFLPQEPYEHPIMDGNFEHLAINALMACKAKHPLMKKFMDNLPNFFHMWNLLDSTGPHYITLLYKQYIAENQFPDTDDNGVYLAPAEYFFPTIDPEKFGYMRQICTWFESLNDLQKRACVSLKLKGLEREPYSFSFTNHHWMHTYLKFRSTFKGPVNLMEFIPNAVMYTPTRFPKENKTV